MLVHATRSQVRSTPTTSSTLEKNTSKIFWTGEISNTSVVCRASKSSTNRDSFRDKHQSVVCCFCCAVISVSRLHGCFSDCRFLFSSFSGQLWRAVLLTNKRKFAASWSGAPPAHVKGSWLETFLSRSAALCHTKGSATTKIVRYLFLKVQQVFCNSLLLSRRFMFAFFVAMFLISFIFTSLLKVGPSDKRSSKQNPPEITVGWFASSSLVNCIFAQDLKSF